MAREDYKTRNWVTVVYPESAPEGWRDILRDECVQALISPLHNADTNPTEEQKKAHYHVMVLFDGPKRFSFAEEFMKSIGGVGCKACNSVRGYARYLCHLDNPEKAQYDEADVECFGGADYYSLISLPTDKYLVIDQMQQWCLANQCVSFRWLFDYARNKEPAWYRELCDRSSRLMMGYIKSLKWELDTYGGIVDDVRGKARQLKEASGREQRVEDARQEQLRDLAVWQEIMDEEVAEAVEKAAGEGKEVEEVDQTVEEVRPEVAGGGSVSLPRVISLGGEVAESGGVCCCSSA